MSTCTYASTESYSCRSAPNEDGKMVRKCERIVRKFKRCPGSPPEEVEVTREETTEDISRGSDLSMDVFRDPFGTFESEAREDGNHGPFDGNLMKNPMEELLHSMLGMHRDLSATMPDRDVGHGSQWGEDKPGFFERMLRERSGQKGNPHSKQETKFERYEKEFQEV